MESYSCFDAGDLILIPGGICLGVCFFLVAVLIYCDVVVCDGDDVFFVGPRGVEFVVQGICDQGGRYLCLMRDRFVVQCLVRLYIGEYGGICGRDEWCFYKVQCLFLRWEDL